MRSQAVVAYIVLLLLLQCCADRDPDKLRNFKSNKGRGAAVELGGTKLRRIKENAAFRGNDEDFAALLEQDDDVVSCSMPAAHSRQICVLLAEAFEHVAQYSRVTS
jgi:hypothetical protein